MVPGPGSGNERQHEEPVRFIFADFLMNQFGEQTMAQYGVWFRGMDEDDEKKNESGTFALHSLGEDETIARLATGIKRFKLPNEFNFIKIYQQIADDPKTGSGDRALEQLAQVFENRRQYPKAAGYWRRVIKEYGPGQNNYRRQRSIRSSIRGAGLRRQACNPPAVGKSRLPLPQRQEGPF